MEVQLTEALVVMGEMPMPHLVRVRYQKVVRADLAALEELAAVVVMQVGALEELAAVGALEELAGMAETGV